MNTKFLLALPVASFYDNSVDALIPELWAQESLAILEENMVAGMLVHRDFEQEFAQFGDTVNTRRPGEFQAKRKTNSDEVTVQDVASTNVPVKLNQHVHVSFMIKDGEEAVAFKNLVEEYLQPAMLAQARFVDQIVLGQFPQFLANTYGSLGGMSGTNARTYILGVRNVLNVNKAYQTGRNLIWTPDGETSALNTDLFTAADAVGDDGTALREASLGRKLGLSHYMSQNMSEPTDGDIDSSNYVVNSSGGYAAGTTSLTIGTGSAALPANSWIKIAGDATPLRVVTGGSSSVTALTIASPGLRHAVAHGAAITSYGGGAVNLSAGYLTGYSKYVKVNGFTIAPKVGQFVTFGTDPTSPIYTIIDYDSTDGLLLDRPLEAGLSNSDAVNLCPGGQYNFAFHRNALALVVRPLPPPRSGTGALSAVVNYNGLSMRAVITYDGAKQGHLVTLDMLCGIAVLDTNLGAVLFG